MMTKVIMSEAPYEINKYMINPCLNQGFNLMIWFTLANNQKMFYCVQRKNIHTNDLVCTHYGPGTADDINKWLGKTLDLNQIEELFNTYENVRCEVYPRETSQKLTQEEKNRRMRFVKKKVCKIWNTPSSKKQI